MITEDKFNYMMDKLNLVLNDEMDYAKKLKKNIQSLQIKRVGYNFIVSFWYGDRFKEKARVSRTK